jgi:hypothetical protein
MLGLPSTLNFEPSYKGRNADGETVDIGLPSVLRLNAWHMLSQQSTAAINFHNGKYGPSPSPSGEHRNLQQSLGTVLDTGFENFCLGGMESNSNQ